MANMVKALSTLAVELKFSIDGWLSLTFHLVAWNFTNSPLDFLQSLLLELSFMQKLYLMANIQVFFTINSLTITELFLNVNAALGKKHLGLVNFPIRLLYLEVNLKLYPSLTFYLPLLLVNHLKTEAVKFKHLSHYLHLFFSIRTFKHQSLTFH